VPRLDQCDAPVETNREDSTAADAQAAADEQEQLAQREQDLENALLVSLRV